MMLYWLQLVGNNDCLCVYSNFDTFEELFNFFTLHEINFWYCAASLPKKHSQKDKRVSFFAWGRHCRDQQQSKRISHRQLLAVVTLRQRNQDVEQRQRDSHCLALASRSGRARLHHNMLQCNKKNEGSVVPRRAECCHGGGIKVKRQVLVF